MQIKSYQPLFLLVALFFIFLFFLFFPPQVKFWSQHISFILVGIIIVTSIRGLLITLTKVKASHDKH